MQAEGSLAWPGGDWRVSCVGFTLNLSFQSGNLRGLDVFVDSCSSPPCNKTWEATWVSIQPEDAQEFTSVKDVSQNLSPWVFSAGGLPLTASRHGG